MLWIALSFALSIDCTDIINLATAAQLDKVQPTMMSDIRLNCCTTAKTKVTCNGLQRVTAIDWKSLNLNGTLNMTAIPSTVTTFFMFYNRLTGPISHFPTGIQSLQIHGNQLDGDIPVLPPGSTYVYLFENNFTGSVPLLPSTMYDYLVNDNKLTGGIPTNLSSGLSGIQVQNNQLNGTVPVLPSGLQYLRLYNNLLTGNAPPLPYSLQYYQIEGNFFVGTLSSIPTTVTIFTIGSSLLTSNRISGSVSLYRPSQVQINFNLISSFSITDKTQLSMCDLSYTPLQGKVNSYTTCIRNGLYTPQSASIVALPSLTSLQTSNIASTTLNTIIATFQVPQQTSEYSISVKTTINDITTLLAHQSSLESTLPTITSGVAPTMLSGESLTITANEYEYIESITNTNTNMLSFTSTHDAKESTIAMPYTTKVPQLPQVFTRKIIPQTTLSSITSKITSSTSFKSTKAIPIKQISIAIQYITIESPFIQLKKDFLISRLCRCLVSLLVFGYITSQLYLLKSIRSNRNKSSGVYKSDL